MKTDISETEAENARAVAALREIFSPIMLRLTPDIEPAIVYVPTNKDEPDPKEPTL